MVCTSKIDHLPEQKWTGLATQAGRSASAAAVLAAQLAKVGRFGWPFFVPTLAIHKKMITAAERFTGFLFVLSRMKPTTTTALTSPNSH